MKVKLDDIRVDSFATTAEAEAGAGTVRGYEEVTLLLLTCYLSCPPRSTCPECPPPAMRERVQED